MSREIHEEILLYLFELRYGDEKNDLLIKFNHVNRAVLTEAISHLESEGFIEVEYPFVGIGTFDFESGRIDYPYAEREDFRNAKIRTAGIEYVNQRLLKKPDTLDKWSKIIGIGGVLLGIIIGTVTLLRESKYQEERQLNKGLLLKVDSVLRVQKAVKNGYDSLLKSKEKRIRQITFQFDSLRNQIDLNTPKK